MFLCLLDLHSIFTARFRLQLVVSRVKGVILCLYIGFITLDIYSPKKHLILYPTCQLIFPIIMIALQVLFMVSVFLLTCQHFQNFLQFLSVITLYVLLLLFIINVNHSTFDRLSSPVGGLAGVCL